MNDEGFGEVCTGFVGLYARHVHVRVPMARFVTFPSSAKSQSAGHTTKKGALLQGRLMQASSPTTCAEVARPRGLRRSAQRGPTAHAGSGHGQAALLKVWFSWGVNTSISSEGSSRVSEHALHGSRMA